MQPTEDDDSENGRPVPEDVPLQDLGKSGLLTRRQREYLLGQNSYTSDQQERKARKRIRDRVRTGLQDFALLARYLEPRDVVQILSDVDAQIREPERRCRQDGFEGVINAVAFLYLITYRAGVPFEQFVEQGLLEAQSSDLLGPFTILDATVSIDDTRHVDTEDAVRKLKQGIDLTRWEYFGLKRVLIQDLDRFLEQTQNITIDLEHRTTAEERLSRGKSLIVLARAMDAPARIDPAREADLLHERVLADFGLSGRTNAASDTECHDQPTPAEVANELANDHTQSS